MKRNRVVLRLILLCLTGVLAAGCASVKPGPSTGSVTAVGSEADTQLPEPESIALIENGVAKFSIISNGQDYAKAAQALADLLYGKTRVTFPTRKFDSNPDSSGKIFVGCDYNGISQTDTALWGAYGVLWQNGNLYICGDNADLVTKCVNEFASQITLDMVKKDESGNTALSIPVSFCFLKNPAVKVPDPILCGKPIKDYRIVVAAGATGTERYLADSLREAIANDTGRMLDLITDAIPASGNEIICGKTARTAGKAFYTANPADGAWEIKAEGSSVCLGYGSVFAIQEMVDAFHSIYRTENTKNNAQIYISGTVTLDTRLQKAAATDVRVMSSNVQYVGYDLSGADPDARMTILAQMYDIYNPDFIGCQECNGVMRNYLTPHLPERYVWVDFADKTGKIDYFPVLYDKTVWKVVESGTGDFPMQGHPWGFVWVRFARLSDPSDTFILFNMHLTWDESQWPAYGKEITKEMNAKIKNILANEPNTPIAVTGDYNNTRNGGYFRSLIEGIEDQMESAAFLTEDINHDANMRNRLIDHVTINKEIISAVCFREIEYFSLSFASDHFSVFADLRVKS